VIVLVLFSGKIKCKHCGSNYIGRKYRKRRVYICSRRHNYNECVRIPIEEEFLRGLIERHFQRKMTDTEIREIVDYIEVEDKLLFEIHFHNSNPIIFSKNFIQY